MNKFFYPKLALTNIKNNKSFYIPYLLAGTLIVSLFYILRSVTVMVGNSDYNGVTNMTTILTLSSFICGFFALIVIFYINSFIMKRRKKEFGLFCILGMEKKHLAFTMGFEVLFTSLASIVAGILGGAVFSQLMFMLLMKMIGIPIRLTVTIPLAEVAITVVLFSVGYFFVYLYDIISIARTQPIELLRGSEKGEKEPKARWLIAILGFVALGGGYALSFFGENPSLAVAVFLPAVILVIIGTYLLFIAGSIAILKLLRRNKKFYYKSENFVSVSGMLYRMKQNAAGLATICILSTCVLVTLATTLCLYLGEEDILRQRYPREYTTSVVAFAESDTQTLNKSVEDYISESNLTIDNEIMYSQFSRSAIQKDNQFSYYQSYTNGISEIVVITQKDYNHLASTNETLSTGEILLYSKDDYPFDTLVLEGINYNIKKQVPRLDTIHFWGMGNEILLVVPTFDDLCTIAETFNSLKNNNIRAIIDYQYKFDLVGDKAEKEQVFSNMRTRLLESNEHLSDVSSRDANRLEFYSLYGCVVFVGAFFIVLFTIAAVLIIYYKQITEGFDDHDRFKIMQKVGMSQKEVKSTISKQVLLVFFMPLLLASVHLAFAFPSLTNILRALNLSNMTLFTLCCICTVLVFAVLYLIVYALTAKTYYKIVEA